MRILYNIVLLLAVLQYINYNSFNRSSNCKSSTACSKIQRNSCNSRSSTAGSSVVILAVVIAIIVLVLVVVAVLVAAFPLLLFCLLFRLSASFPASLSFLRPYRSVLPCFCTFSLAPVFPSLAGDATRNINIIFT